MRPASFLPILTALLACPSMLHAQVSPAPAGSAAADPLTVILDRAEANIEAYRRNVPNVYCTEHAVAKRKVGNTADAPEMAVPGGSAPLNHSATIENSAETTAIFRLKRADDPATQGLFEESRIQQKVTYSADAPGFEQIAIPTLLYGVFSNGLNILSREGRNCFAFTLKSSKPGKPITVDFQDLPPARRAPACPATSEGRGSIRLDPATMHVTRIDRDLPHHRLVGNIIGNWQWSEEYAPVDLNGATFWLPSSIRSRSVSADGTSTWTFDATYRNYHLFFSSTRILPGAGF